MKHHKRLIAGSIVTLALAGAIWAMLHQHAQAPTVPPATTTFQPDPRTKSDHCVINGPYPDHACTPGAIFSDVTKDQVCAPGYSSSVRNVPQSEKNEDFAEYGITHHATGGYEVDHFISLELGGSNDIANLFPEAAVPVPGFHEKDKVENYLHAQVCNGSITLAEAQREISGDWVKVYGGMPGR